MTGEGGVTRDPDRALALYTKACNAGLAGRTYVRGAPLGERQLRRSTTTRAPRSS